MIEISSDLPQHCSEHYLILNIFITCFLFVFSSFLTLSASVLPLCVYRVWFCGLWQPCSSPEGCGLTQSQWSPGTDGKGKLHHNLHSVIWLTWWWWWWCSWCMAFYICLSHYEITDWVSARLIFFMAMVRRLLSKTSYKQTYWYRFCKWLPTIPQAFFAFQ